jgi:hypothetical protein
MFRIEILGLWNPIFKHPLKSCSFLSVRDKHFENFLHIMQSSLRFLSLYGLPVASFYLWRFSVSSSDDPHSHISCYIGLVHKFVRFLSRTTFSQQELHIGYV